MGCCTGRPWADPALQIGGYNVFPGTCVVVNGWGIGRDPRHWKKSPNEIYPEMLENMEVDLLGNHFEMVLFGYAN
ncbi:hypothetical protein OSB04_027325 [Centaurea solstitialis]|uniref:Uncharacterized protein n=1 Tax=Centaurea solstitialis TaxID=347529 RepID=A0AA38SF21_9ASTR|nr:hypothetical protein OSB04_027325 [Centaurea solstitialis]